MRMQCTYTAVLETWESIVDHDILIDIHIDIS